MLDFLRGKVLISIIFSLFALGSFFYLFYLQRENARLKQALTSTTEALYSCHQENLALSRELRLQHKKYQAKINKLLKLANKPTKVIKVPKIITKKIYITPKECRQMAQMIDEFIEIERKGQ